MIAVRPRCDDRGKDAYNKKLSQRRAEAVVTYLVNKGIDAGRLEPIGYGEEKPVADNGTKEGRAANRRVVFTIVGGAPGVETRSTGPTDETIDR